MLAFFPTSTNTVSPTVTFTPTPRITATPIALDKSNKDVHKVIDELLDSVRGSCDKVEYLDLIKFDEWTPKFTEATNQIGFQNTVIKEIADSFDGKYRAYIVTNYFSGRVCMDCGMDLLYLEDTASNQIYNVEWINQELVLFRSIIWIGEKTLLVYERAFQENFYAKGIDVIDKKFISSVSIMGCR